MKFDTVKSKLSSDEIQYLLNITMNDKSKETFTKIGNV